MTRKNRPRTYTSSRTVKDVIGLHKQVGTLQKKNNQMQKVMGVLYKKLEVRHKQNVHDSNIIKQLRILNPILYQAVVAKVLAEEKNPTTPLQYAPVSKQKTGITKEQVYEIIDQEIRDANLLLPPESQMQKNLVTLLKLIRIKVSQINHDPFKKR